MAKILFHASTMAAGFHVSEIIQDELNSRGWSLQDLASRMKGDYATNLLALELLWCVNDVNCHMGRMADDIADALGVSRGYIKNLDKAWRGWMKIHGKKRVEPAAICLIEIERGHGANDNLGQKS